MKRFFLYLAAVVCLASCNNKDLLWMTPMVDIDARVTYLEQLCMQMNTNISSMQTIIQALQERDYVTNVAEIKEGNEVIGYTITFAKNPSITIYKGNDGKDGKDGKDGADGKDGKDGITPQIGVAIDGGIYYWTLNGEWLLDANGNKLRVTGENGKDGADGVDGKDGKDGEDGQDGTNGQDGITPKLKIENDYWYISYNNGATWTQLGKAKGDKGETGAAGAAGKDGADGKDGDSMFKSVTQDDSFVYFTLADDSVIKISIKESKYHIGFGPGTGNVTIQNGAIMAKFTVGEGKQVYFSQGNLQFNVAQGTHQCADGTTKPGTWRFAENQYDIIGEDNLMAAATYNGWIDLFGWGTSGWNNGNLYYQPYNHEYNAAQAAIAYGYGPTDGTNYDYSLVGDYAYSDWGIYNAISNGGNQPNQWRALTSEEWNYLLFKRNHAISLQSRVRLQFSTDSIMYGLIIFPDSVSIDGIMFLGNASTFDFNVVSYSDWEICAENGAIFLPCSGTVSSAGLNMLGTLGEYWSSSCDSYQHYAQFFRISSNQSQLISLGRSTGSSVRLVKDVE